MRRNSPQFAIQLLWLLAGCDSGSLESHQVQVPTKLIFTEQPTGVIAGAAIRPAVSVTVQDAHGNIVTSATTGITVSLRSNPWGGTLSGATTLAAVGGVATFPDLSVDRSGRGYLLNADASELNGAVSSFFNVSLSPATLAFEVQPSTTGADQTIAPAIRVAVVDVQGNTVESAGTSVTLGMGNNPAGARLSGTPTVGVVNGLPTRRSPAFRSGRTDTSSSARHLESR